MMFKSFEKQQALALAAHQRKWEMEDLRLKLLGEELEKIRIELANHQLEMARIQDENNNGLIQNTVKLVKDIVHLFSK